MAGQRWSEPRRRGFGCRARGRGLALLVPLILGLAACDGDPVGPRGGLPDGGNGAGASGGGGGTTATALVGDWRTIVVIEVPGDLQTWTTTWHFESAGSCRQTVVTESLAEGFPRTTERACSWTTNDGQVAITFVGGGTLSFDFSFAALDPDRLVLDGFEYHRLA
jgi:hypothetical protein